MEKINHKIYGRRRKEFPEKRNKKDAQLWRNGFIKILCRKHGWQKIPMLSSLVCPCCKRERRHSDLLRRSEEEEFDREYLQHDSITGLEEYGNSQIEST